MNKSFLIGRITKDLELRCTSTGKYVCEFNIAVNRTGVEGVDFLTCVVWNKQAENLAKYQGKGSLIAVEGSNRVDKYETKEGNTGYKHYILANNISYLGNKNENSTVNDEESTTNNYDNDLPF